MSWDKFRKKIFSLSSFDEHDKTNDGTMQNDISVLLHIEHFCLSSFKATLLAIRMAPDSFWLPAGNTRNRCILFWSGIDSFWGLGSDRFRICWEVSGKFWTIWGEFRAPARGKRWWRQPETSGNIKGSF